MEGSAPSVITVVPVAVPVAVPVQVVQAAPVDGSATLAEPGFLMRPASPKLGFLKGIFPVVPVVPTVPATVAPPAQVIQGSPVKGSIDTSPI